MKEGSLEGVEEGVDEEGQVKKTEVYPKKRTGSIPTNLFLNFLILSNSTLK